MRAGKRAIRLALAAAAALTVSVGVARAEFSQLGNLVVVFDGGVAPHSLPRDQQAPISMVIGTSFSTTDGSRPPALRRLTLDLNRHGRLFAGGLPSCTVDQLRTATTAQALRRCRGALVGRGHVSSAIEFPEQAPFPAEGALLAFNGNHGRSIITHVYGTNPLPTTYVLPFRIVRQRSGPYGTHLLAEFPSIASDWGYVKDFSLTLRRTFRSHGRKQSYLTAACAVPNGYHAALFPLARATYNFDGDRTTST